MVDPWIVIPVVGSSSLLSHPKYAKIAQLVEHLFEAQGVGSSILSLGTIPL